MGHATHHLFMCPIAPSPHDTHSVLHHPFYPIHLSLVMKWVMQHSVSLMEVSSKTVCHFLQKSPQISGSFAKKDLQLKDMSHS